MSNERTTPQVGTDANAASERAGSRSDRTDEVSPSPTDQPLVSVVITTYDRLCYLREAVQSVLEQTYESIELVIVDDHSETPAREAIADLDLGRLEGVQLVRHETNRGANAARNTGIRAVTGEYVAFLDDDDRWVPEKIERQLAAFRAADEDVGVVYTSIQSVEPGGITVRERPVVDGDITRSLLCRNVVGTMSVVMVRTDVARAVPLDEAFPAWADLEWYVRLSQRTDFECLPEPLTVYEFTSHGRLSDDFEKLLEGYELFVDRFDPVAAGYGPLVRRKMRGWAAYRIGAAALAAGRYDSARRFLATAVASYPFEPRFSTYLLAALGGRLTHGLARKVHGVTA